VTFYCNGCESDKGFYEFSLLLIEKWGEGIKRFCRNCRAPKAYLPDVYFDGKPEENLADGPDGKPRVFFSKGEKAAYLKSRGIMEAGDRVHGAPVQVHKNQERKVDTRHEVQMALKKVREMGRDNRRQEYLKICRENGRYAR